MVPGARRPLHDELPEDVWEPRPEVTVLPPEVAAIVAAERAAIVEDELLLEAERADYEARLAEMRQARPTPLRSSTISRGLSCNRTKNGVSGFGRAELRNTGCH